MGLERYLHPHRQKLALALVVLFVASGLVYRALRVEASALDVAQQIVRACEPVSKEQTKHERCTAKEFATVGEKRGLPFIGEVLTAYQSLNTGYQAYQNCHVLSHRIMNDLGSRQPGAWKELLGKMSAGEMNPTRCGGGFVHGLLEVRAGEDPNFKVNADLFTEICSNTVATESSTSCAHILGHLALVEASGNLPEALKSCDGLTEEFLFQCYGGIFMEDSMRTNLADHGLAELPERNMAWFQTQLARCSRYPNNPEATNGCWYDMPEVFAQTHNYDLKQTYAFCATAPSVEARDRCYMRGSYLIALIPDYMFQESYPKDLCADYLMQNGKLPRCMQDVIGAALTGSMQLLDRTISFCAARPDNAKVPCQSMVASQVSRLVANKEEKSALCSKLPEGMRASCLR